MILESSACLVVAEVAQAHDGSLGTAHALIDAIAKAGADAAKFQTHIASAESTPGEPWRVKFSQQDLTRYDYWKRMEFTEEQWHGLKQHAVESGLQFLSSPFSAEAVELLMRVGVAAWKVASGEVSNLSMIERLAQTGRPVLLSSGMSSWADLDAAVDVLRSHGARLAVLQCTSAYPTTPELVGLNVLTELRRRYACPVGLSDHSGTIFPSLAAVALGARVVEVHVTLSRHAFGPDVCASVTIEELRELVRGIRFIERALSCPVDKNLLAEKTVALRVAFGKSVVARRDLPAGTVLQEEDLVLKKPGGGLPPSELASAVGRMLRRGVGKDQMILEGDLV
ncbi:MAG: N-acetylneuraminate synthase family protein [Acidobacteriota bacterium]